MTSNALLINALYIIDSRISLADRERLIAGLPVDSAWALIEETEDGVGQIRDIVSNYSGLGAIHLIGHGSPGSLLLGASQIDLATINQQVVAWAQIGSSLNETGDILLYGCNTAQGQAGLDTLEQLARITGADIAASVDRTGNPDLGGNWALETSIGTIEAAPISAPNFESLLTAPTVTTFTTTAKRPSLSGLANIVVGKALEVEVAGVTYTTANGLVISGNNWTLNLPQDLAETTHQVVARLVDAGPAAPITVSGSGSVIATNASIVNRLAGGSSSDTLTGASRADVAVFSGNRSDYTITAGTTGITVTDKRTGSVSQGTDTLTNLNQLKFADGQEFVLAASERVALTGVQNQVAVNASKLYNGTKAAETFVVAKNVSAMILAGNGDTVDLSGRITDYTYSAKGSQLQISDGAYTTTINIGGNVTLRTASGSANVTLSFGSGGPIIALGAEIVGDSEFNPAAAIASASAISSNAETIVSANSQVVVAAPFTLTDTESMTLYLINQIRHDPAGWATRLGIDLTKDSSGAAVSALANLGNLDSVVANESLFKAAKAYAQVLLSVNATPLVHDYGNTTQTTRDTAAGYTLGAGSSAAENLNSRSGATAYTSETIALKSVEDLFKDTGVSGATHRVTLLSDAYNELGIGYALSADSKTFYGAQDFASNAVSNTASYLTGFVMNDANGNLQYNVGDGLGGVSVTVTGAKGTTYTTTTQTHGYWAVQVADNDTYTIVVSGGAYQGTGVVTANVLSADTVSVDFISGQVGGWVNFQRDTGTEQTISENLDPRTTVIYQPSGTIAAGSVFTLGGADAEAFTVDPQTGKVLLKALPDYEKKGSYTIDIIQSIGGSVSASRTMTLNVQDQNEAPMGVVLSNVIASMTEGVSSRVKVADLTIQDDVLGTNTLSLVGADASLFEISSGALYLKAGVTLNHSIKSHYDVAVQAKDSALGVAVGAAYSLKVSTTDLKLSVTDVQGDAQVVSLSGVAQNVQPISFAATRFDTALALLEGANRELRVLDLHTGNSLGSKVLGAGEYVVAMPGKGTQFALASYSADKVVLNVYSEGLDASSGSLAATPLSTLTLDQTFSSRTQTGAGTWDFQNSDGTYSQLKFTSASTGTLTQYSKNNTALTSSVAVPVTNTGTDTEFIAYKTLQTEAAAALTSTSFSHEFFMQGGVLYIKEDVKFTVSGYAATYDFIRYRSYSNNVWHIESAADYADAQTTGLSNPVFGSAYNYYYQDANSVNYLVTSGNAQNPGCLYVFKSDANGGDTAWQGAAVYELPVNDHIASAVYANGTMWLSVESYDNEAGGLRTSYYTLSQNEWQVTPKASYDAAFSAAVKPGSVARMGSAALDMLTLLPTGDTTVIADADVVSLGGDQYLVRAEVTSQTLKTGYEHWVTYNAATKQIQSQKAFSSNTDLVLRSVDSTDAAYVYVQSLDVSATSAGFGLQNAAGALTVYRIPVASVASVLAQAVHYGAAALTDNAYRVASYSNTQLLGDFLLEQSQTASLSQYMPLDNGHVNLISTVSDAQASGIGSVVTHLNTSGQVTSAVVLPAPLAKLVTLGALGTFIQTEPDSSGAAHALRLDQATGGVTEIPYAAFLDLSYEVPVGLSTQFGGYGNDVISGADAGQRFVDTGNGNDTITLSLGKDVVGAGQGADQIIVSDPAKLSGDQLNGGAEAETIDRLTFAPSVANSTLDLGTASVRYVDAVEIGTDRLGTAVVLSSDAAASADYNRNGVEGDMAVVAGATLTQGVTVSASALKSGESLYFGGQTLADGSSTAFIGNDVVVGGIGNDVIMAGAGNDTLTGGLGADRLVGDLGADTFVYQAAEELVGDQLDATAEKNTLDTLRIAATSDNQSFDLTKAASIQYIDQITLANDRIGQSIKLSGGINGVAAYANANGDSTAGDLRINADATLVHGVVVDAALLTANQTLQLDGSRMMGSDVVTAGVGNDQLIYGGGRDTYTLGAGNDRVQINRGATGLLTITDFSTASDTLDFAALVNGSAVSLKLEPQSGSTLITVLDNGVATGLQVLLQGVTTTAQTLSGSNAWAGKPAWLDVPATQSISLQSPNGVSASVAASTTPGLQSVMPSAQAGGDTVTTVVEPSINLLASSENRLTLSTESDCADCLPTEVIQVASTSSASPITAIVTPDTVLATTGSTATALLVGQNNGVLEAPGDHDWYKVHLTPGAYYLKLKDNFTDYTVGAYNDNQDNIYYQVPIRVVVLRDANGVALTAATNWSSGPGDVSTSYTLPINVEGDYFLDVYSWCPHCSGAYGFEIGSFADDSAGTTATARPLAVGSSAPGVINYGGDTDWFELTLQAGHTYVFTQNGEGLGDPFLSLMSSGGALIESNDDGSLGGELNARYTEWSAQKTADKLIAQKSLDDYSALIKYTATTTGTYYLKAAGRITADSGGYKLTATDITSSSDSVGASISSYGNLQVNHSANGIVDYAGDKDWYSITLNAGVAYLLRGQTLAGAGNLADPLLRLYNASGQYLAFNNDLSDDPEGVGYDASLRAHDALITYTPTATATYYIEVAGANNAVGQYQVSAKALDDAPGSTATTQKVIVNNQAISGLIEVAGDLDWYGVYLTAGVTYEFDANQASTSGLTNPYLSLRDGAGGQLAANDDTQGLNAHIRYTASTTGLHYLAVEDAGNGSGQYYLTAMAADDYANGISTQGLVTLSNRQSGTGSGGAAGRIDYGGDQDCFRIELQAGDLYTIRVQGAGSGNGLTLIDPRLTGVYTEDGDFVVQSGNDDFGGSRDAMLVFHAAKSGTYYLAVAGASLNDIGTYQVTVDRQTPSDILATTATTADLQLGTAVASSIDSATDVDWHRVQLTQGVSYVIDLAGDVTSQMMLSDALFKGVYDASGALIAGSTNNNYGASQNSRMVFTPTTTGTYYLAAGSNDGTTGDYRLMINALPQAVVDDAGETLTAGGHGTLALVNGAGATSGLINFARDVDWQSVQLVQGQTYEITVRGAASGMGTLLDPRLNGIYDSNGHLIIGTGADSGDGGVDVRTRFTATSDATYYLAVAGTADMTGSYRVEVKPALMTDEVEANINTKATLAVGGSFENQIETVGDVDWVKVHLESNQSYQLMLQGVDGSMGMLDKPAMLALVDSTGRSVSKLRYVEQAQYTANGWTVSIRDAATAYAWDTSALPAGDYYIQVGAYAGSTGAYSLRVNASPLSVTDQQGMSFGPTLLSVNSTTLPSYYYRDGHTVYTDSSQIVTQFSNMAYDSNLTLTFGDWYGAAAGNILKGTGNIRLVGSTSSITIDVNSDQVMVTGNIVTINPSVNLKPSDTYALMIDAGAFTDAAGNAFGGLGIERQIYYSRQVTNGSGGVDIETGYTTFVDPNELVFTTGATATAASAKAAWTLMVYMDADNELESQALADLKEMAAVSLPANVNLIVKLDRAGGYSAENFAGSNETGTATYRLTSSGWVRISGAITEDNMADPATLSSFISTTKSAYAADNYGLVMWGPGGGIYGTAWDQSSGMDNLTVAELKTALTNGLGADKLGVLAFDSSLMGLQEVLHAVKDSTGIMVASEDLMPSTGLAYGTLLQRLAMNPTMTANELAIDIVNTYADQNAGGLTTTMAAFSTTSWKQITSWLDKFANYALTKASMTQEDWVMLVDALSAVNSGPTHDVTRDYYHDLRDFMNYVLEHSAGTSPLIGSARMIVDNLDYFMTIASVTGDSGSIGLGIYSPNGTGVTSAYTDTAFSMLGAVTGAAPNWDDLIKRLQYNTTNNAPSDLVVTPNVSTRTASHVAELLDQETGYKLTDDLKLASVYYTDDIWIAGNEYVLTGTDSAYFKIVDGALYLKRGTVVSYSDANNTDHQYSVGIQIRDKTLSTLGSNSNQTYTVTIDHVDVTSPSITSSKQVLVSSSVGTGTVYTLTATDDVDSASSLVYSLQPGGNASLFNMDAQGHVSFKQAPTNGSYNLTLLATDATGNQAAHNLSINVWSPTVGPIVTSASPADDANKVALNSNIMLNFNEAISRGTGSITLKTLAGSVVETFAAGSGRVSINGQTLTIDPTAQLQNNTTYIVELAQGAVTDTTASHYASAAVLDYNFKTVGAISGATVSANDVSAPVLANTSAADLVAINGVVPIQFSEAVQRGAGVVLLKDNSGTVVDAIDVASSAVRFSGNTLTIDPAVLMNRSGHYTLELGAGAVLDGAGNGNAVCSYGINTQSQGAFDIVCDYSDISIANKESAPGGLGQTVMQYVKQAVDYAVGLWESVIIDSPGSDRFNLVIKIDDTIECLGQGGPTSVLGDLPSSGHIILKTTDLGYLNSTGFKAMVVHEVGHTLGMGTLWDGFGYNAVFGEYTGVEALKVYQSWMNNNSLTYVPLETGGGSGTSNAHWSESLFGMEIMTGYQTSSTETAQISALTVAALMDLGYTVDKSQANLSYQLAGVAPTPEIDVSNLITPSLQQTYAVI